MSLLHYMRDGDMSKFILCIVQAEHGHIHVTLPTLFTWLRQA